MRTVATIVGLLCWMPSCMAAEFNPFDGPKPIVVFIESDPWLMVIGSDTPRVAIYDDGQMIFVKKVDGRLAYHHVTVDKETLAAFRDRLKPVLALKGLKRRYDVRPNVTDQPEAMFYLRDGDRQVTTRVYGLTADGAERRPSTAYPDGPEPDVPPTELLKLHKWLCSLDLRGGKEWTPKYVEVMLWDYSYAPDPSIQWPKQWPSLDSAGTIKRGEDQYSIFLDGAMLPELRKFLATRKEKGAVEVAGKKFAASYRRTFPGEPLWMAAFYDIAEKGGSSAAK